MLSKSYPLELVLVFILFFDTLTEIFTFFNVVSFLVKLVDGYVSLPEVDDLWVSLIAKTLVFCQIELKKL